MTDSEDAMHPEVDAGEVSGPMSVGDRLRAARERKGLTIDQIASETRISRRHLESIESGDFETLPGRTYAVGFTRTYAKTLGLDEDEAVAQVREEMDLASVNARYDAQQNGTFEPGDPSRAPGGRLLYFSLFAVVVLLVGIFFAARALFAPAAEMPSLVEQERMEAQRQAEQRQTAAAQAGALGAPQASASGGEVVFTAEGETWVRFYDGEGTVLREGTLTEGETFTVPADAQNPQLITGRPDRLAITVGGRPVPKLSNEVETLSDVPISAQALLDRPGAAQVIGFSLGTAAPQTSSSGTSPQAAMRTASPALAAATPVRTPATRPTANRALRIASAPAPAETAAQASTPEVDEPTPEPVATAPPQATPAEGEDDTGITLPQ